MEVLAGDLLRGLVIVKLAHQRIVRALADRRGADMLAERAEIAGDADLILETDLLVAEENHLETGEGIVQFFHLLVAQRCGEIDPADLGADMRTGRRCRNRLILNADAVRGDLGNLRKMGGSTYSQAPFGFVMRDSS